MLVNAFAALGCMTSMIVVGAAIFAYLSLATPTGKQLLRRLFGTSATPQEPPAPSSRKVPDDLRGV